LVWYSRSPSAFDEGGPAFGCGHSWMNLSESWTHGSPSAFVRLGPDPGSSSAFDEGGPAFGCGHSWMNLSESWTRGESRWVFGGRRASAP
jgi:hypothetical protein